MQVKSKTEHLKRRTYLDKPPKKALLEKYAEPHRDVHTFLQLDGFLNVLTDSVMTADEDGHCLMAGITHEIRASPSSLAVRVLIHKGTTKDDVVRLLKKMLAWVKRGWETTILVGDSSLEWWFKAEKEKEK